MRTRRNPFEMQVVIVILVWALLLATDPVRTTRMLRADESGASSKMTTALSGLAHEVLTPEQRERASGMIEADIQRRTRKANQRNRSEWLGIRTREQWETYRDERLRRLRESLGPISEASGPPNVKVTGTVNGDGFQIDKIVYESQPGDWVTAHLYRPAEPRESMPGILITHAHHRPKQQGELQDMGMTWARAGCLVLIIDQVGHGERAGHPFRGPEDYPKEDYKYWRQDYHYRYDCGIQLHLMGESLMGWMVRDSMRGVDLLLDTDGIDPTRMILLGAVAGGGDPCGVTAALDRRISAAVPFNFGGPQPETVYHLPDDAETSFNYLLGAHWESTRGLRRTAADGFFHWVIVGGIAPRRLVYGHEFAWDRDRDPVWKRFQKIYGDFYGVPGNLAFTHGYGTLRGTDPRGSHCTNIGPVHRKMIHQAFAKWFDIEVDDDGEYSARREDDELTCMTDEARRELNPRSLVQIASQRAQRHLTDERQRRAAMKLDERQSRLRDAWAKHLGEIDPPTAPVVTSSRVEIAGDAEATVERIVIDVEPGISVPMLVITSPPESNRPPSPVVVGLAHSGKAGFLRHRADQLGQLLRDGTIVCLPDLRGMGETSAGTSRGRQSGDGNRSVNVLLFDQTLLGQRLRDLRSVLAYLGTRDDVDAQRISLWGDSFAPVNPVGTDFKVPRGVSQRPHQSEPVGGLLALLGALFEENVERIYVRRGLSSFQSVLESPHVYIPHDIAVPGVLTAGDLADLAAALAPRPLRMTGLVDGLNRPLTVEEMRSDYEIVSDEYQMAEALHQFVIADESSPAEWFLSTRP